MIRNFLAIGLLCTLSSRLIAADSMPLAFPGAQGLAAHATGGRGGSVYRVTNLNDSGPGSFRDAVSQGHRIVVFDVGGYIDLKSRVSIPSDITIAGQSAPGEGIGTFGHSISFSDSKNVIVRYIRFRQGNTPGEEKKSAININKASDMIFDHVSVEWGRWDTVDMTECNDMTMQYCIIGQGVSPQRFGCLCESDNVTFTHDLWINNESRNPKAKGKIQYINNVVYDWGKGGGFIEGHSAADHYDDVVANYFIAGPASDRHPLAQGKPTDKVYSEGNFIDLNANGKLDGVAATDEDLGDITVQKTPFSALRGMPLKIETAQEAYDAVVAEVGCSLHRDQVDQQLIDQVKSLGRDGKLIKDVEEVGGPGHIAASKSDVKVDAAGVPVGWKYAGDAAGSENAGYSRVEVYLNSLVPAAVSH
jgi:pectate lyase